MKETPALKVVYRQVADLIPYARNARTHSDEQVTRIASSIKEFGFTNPILIDGDNGIIAGHGRLMAATKPVFCFSRSKIKSPKWPIKYAKSYSPLPRKNF